MKETTSGKLVLEWQALLDGTASNPELVDITLSVSSLLAIKDDDEIVGFFCVAKYGVVLKLENCTSCRKSDLYTTETPRGSKLESIFDKESKISHEMLSGPIETRLGSGHRHPQDSRRCRCQRP